MGVAWQRACEGASGAPEVGRPVAAPEHVGAVRAQAHVQQLQDVLLVARPGRVHLRGREARVPRAKLCTHTPLPSAPETAAQVPCARLCSHTPLSLARRSLHCFPSTHTRHVSVLQEAIR